MHTQESGRGGDQYGTTGMEKPTAAVQAYQSAGEAVSARRFHTSIIPGWRRCASGGASRNREEAVWLSMQQSLAMDTGDQLPAKERRRLAAAECREACRAWRRREIGGRELERQVGEICRRHGLRAR